MIAPEFSANQVSAALRNAFPYLRLYQGRNFVIKVGGEAFEDEAASRLLLEQISILHRVGIHVLLVHGGGKQVDRLLHQIGREPRFVDGRRVTDPETLTATAMVLCGQVNTGIVAAFRELETPAVGLSGVDGNLITATRRPPVPRDDGSVVDYGEVGDLEAVEPGLLTVLLDQGFLPVVSPLSATSDGRLLNVNADSVAALLAVAVGAEKLIFMTGAPGILRDSDDPTSLLSYTDLSGLGQLLESGAIQRGMLPKLEAIRASLSGGVPRVHVISHRTPDTLLMEIFTNEGAGTLVVPDTADLGAKEATGEG